MKHHPLFDYEVLIPQTEYYPHYFKNPFTAYIIPPDIAIGEKVFAKDLIEDFVEEIG